MTRAMTTIVDANNHTNYITIASNTLIFSRVKHNSVKHRVKHLYPPNNMVIICSFFNQYQLI